MSQSRNVESAQFGETSGIISKRGICKIARPVRWCRVPDPLDREGDVRNRGERHEGQRQNFFQG